VSQGRRGTLHSVGRVEEVPPGHTKFCWIEGKPLIIANWAGRIFALDGICPHRLNPLEGATVCEYLLDCPWHHFQYDVRTGENHYPKNVYPRDYSALQEQVRPLRTYRVELIGSEILVDLACISDTVS
jgi:3-phenylpropionate/trans-cinnamate dioxygenase ferredoxin component